MNILHQELRRAREDAGLSQAELAARAGIPRNQIVRAEKGDNITLDTLRKIAIHLPLEHLTLLENIKLGTDALPLAERVFLESLETVRRIAKSMISAIEVSERAKTAMLIASRDDPARRELLIHKLDDTLVLNGLRNAALKLTGEEEKIAS